MDFNKAVDQLCSFLIKYQYNFESLSNKITGSFKSHYKDAHNMIKENFESGLNMEDLIHGLIKCLIKYDYKMMHAFTFNILDYIINDKLSPKINT